MYYSNLYQDPLYQVAQKSPSTDSRSSDSPSTTPTTPTSTHDFVYPSNYQYLSYKHTNPSRRNQGPPDDIPPVPEMPPIEALDLGPTGTGNTATTATATYPNVALSKRRSQAHINRDSNSSGSASSRRMYDQRQQQQQQYYQNQHQQQQQESRQELRPVEPLYFGENAQSDASQPPSLPRNFPTSLAEHTDRSERRWKQPPPQVTTSYSRLSPPTQGPSSPPAEQQQTTSPTGFSSTLINSISKKTKGHAAPILPMGTAKSAVFWREQEALDKLRMLCAPEEDAENASAFDEIIEFGFPVDPQTANEEVGFGARQMTLHVTLSPAAMRDRDEVLYGWQKELATGTHNNSNPTVDDVSTYQQSHYEEEKSRGPPTLLSGSTGTGGMKRVFGKLKKKGPANSSIMITSADVQ